MLKQLFWRETKKKIKYLIKCQFLKGLQTNWSLETGEFNVRGQWWGELDGQLITRVNRNYIFFHKVFIKRIDYKLPAIGYQNCMCVYMHVFIYIYKSIHRNYISGLLFSLSGSGTLGGVYAEGSAENVNAPSWRIYREFNHCCARGAAPEHLPFCEYSLFSVFFLQAINDDQKPNV